MIHKDYCSKCKRKNIPLIKVSRNKTTQYYYCRSCTADKMRKYIRTSGGLERVSANRDRMTEKYPEKFKARQKVAYALKKGSLTKPFMCEDCGLSGRIEGHHMDYEKPLVLIWLCSACHKARH